MKTILNYGTLHLVAENVPDEYWLVDFLSMMSEKDAKKFDPYIIIDVGKDENPQYPTLIEFEKYNRDKNGVENYISVKSIEISLGGV